VTLSELKRDQAILLAILGRPKAGQHIKCAFHKETTGPMSVWQDSTNVWLWKCHAGCGSGTVIDAAMLRYPEARLWNMSSSSIGRRTGFLTILSN
jgi:hypothetical protein